MALYNTAQILSKEIIWISIILSSVHVIFSNAYATLHSVEHNVFKRRKEITTM